MSKTKQKSGQFVVPGERLGVIEEFTPGSWTYTEDGIVYSEVTGYAMLDMLSREVWVYPLTHAISVPQIGSTVLGQVSDVQNRTATLRILQVNSELASGFFTGVLHISDANRTYIRNMFDVCKTGDIMRAIVVSGKNRMHHLSSSRENMGVVYAFCSKCGHLLLLKGRELHCPTCSTTEKRKIASDYGVK